MRRKHSVSTGGRWSWKRIDSSAVLTAPFADRRRSRLNTATRRRRRRGDPPADRATRGYRGAGCHDRARAVAQTFSPTTESAAESFATLPGIEVPPSRFWRRRDTARSSSEAWGKPAIF